MGVAAVLQGFRLAPGMTLVEFGAGTGWLSRFLTQLGCRVILLDVSPSALAIAREVYERLQVIGERPRPEFLTFDGRRINLPDTSVDRVLSFHAFHHAPNPDVVLREFGRLLKPGDIAGFVEPGQTHSHDPQSQFEMRAYRVVENEVDIHAIWRTARAYEFANVQVAIHYGSPFHVSLAQLEEFLAHGNSRWHCVNATRAFLRHVRTFFLYREGAERIDSRSVDALAGRIEATLHGRATAHQLLVVSATVTNSGDAVWLDSEAECGGVALGVHVYDTSWRLLAFDYRRQRLTEPARDIAPGETVVCHLTVPPRPAGRYTLELDCVTSKVAWFAQVGSPPARIAVDVSAAAP